jgi:hypothetical protein
VNPHEAYRYQKAESRLGAIGGRTEGVKAKDRNSLRRTNLLGTFVAGFDGLADNQIKDVHRFRMA